MADRQTLLRQISAVSFALNEWTLYLDTHPTDQQALAEFKKRRAERRSLMEAYAAEYGPLTVDCACGCGEQGGRLQDRGGDPDRKQFEWICGPLPWEGGI